MPGVKVCRLLCRKENGQQAPWIPQPPYPSAARKGKSTANLPVNNHLWWERRLFPIPGPPIAILWSDLYHQTLGAISSAPARCTKAGAGTQTTTANAPQHTRDIRNSLMSSSTGSSTCLYFAKLLALPSQWEDCPTGHDVTLSQTYTLLQPHGYGAPTYLI